MRAFIFAIFFYSTQLLGTVIHAPSLEIIEEHLNNLDENALVVFDVDYTLIVPNDLILGPSGHTHLLKSIKKIQALPEKEELLLSKVFLQYQVSLVDEKILTILNKLKQKGVKVIALTAMNTGEFGTISNMEQWRVEQLASLGIFLEWSSLKEDTCELKGFQGKKTPPVFKQGVLASAHYPKGKVLCAFLKQKQLNPSKIFFIDDRMEYIDSVESELDKASIEHISFHYTACTDQASPIDEKIADFQFQHLIEQGDWLSDEEAKKEMDSKG